MPHRAAATSGSLRSSAGMGRYCLTVCHRPSPASRARAVRRGWVSSAPKMTSTMIDEEMLLSPELMIVAVMSTPMPMPAASATPKRSMRDTTAAARA